MNIQKVKVKGKWKGSNCEMSPKQAGGDRNPGEGLGGHNQGKSQHRPPPPPPPGQSPGQNEMDRNYKFIFSGKQTARADVLTLKTKVTVLVPN